LVHDVQELVASHSCLGQAHVWVRQYLDRSVRSDMARCRINT